MESKATFLGHPAHRMLVVFPVGLLSATIVFDLGHLFTGNLTMLLVAFWTLSAGLASALLAVPFGFVDWRALPRGTRARAVGAVHGGGNLLVLALFAGSWWLRLGTPLQPSSVALTLSFAGGAGLMVTAWLGGELVSRMGVGVYRNAGPDAPSSMK